MSLTRSVSSRSSVRKSDNGHAQGKGTVRLRLTAEDTKKGGTRGDSPASCAGVFSEFSAGNRSRVEGDKRTKRERAVKVLPGYFGRCDLRADHRDTNSTRCLGPERARPPAYKTSTMTSRPSDVCTASYAMPMAPRPRAHPPLEVAQPPAHPLLTRRRRTRAAPGASPRPIRRSRTLPGR